MWTYRQYGKIFRVVYVVNGEVILMGGTFPTAKAAAKDAEWQGNQ